MKIDELISKLNKAKELGKTEVVLVFEGEWTQEEFTLSYSTKDSKVIGIKTY